MSIGALRLAMDDLPVVEIGVYLVLYELIVARGRPVLEVELRRVIGNVGGKLKGHIYCLISRGLVALEDGKLVIQAAIDYASEALAKRKANHIKALKGWETRHHQSSHDEIMMMTPANTSNPLTDNENADHQSSPLARAVIPDLLTLTESESKNPPNPPTPQTETAEPAPLPHQPGRRIPEGPTVDVSHKKSVELEREFEEVFWPAYPLRKGKGAARPKFVRARSKVSLDVIMAGVTRYVAEKRGVEPRFIKHPSTWLHGECWADDASPAVSPRRDPTQVWGVHYV